VLWRELYRGRRLQQSGELHDAEIEYRAFLEKLDRRPWLRCVWWLAWATYTRDPKAMALNNLGGCLMDLQRLDSAEATLHQAIAIDPLYPMPRVSVAKNSGASTAPWRY
jgi:tetratricopeptide (TPR) repeat protein